MDMMQPKQCDTINDARQLLKKTAEALEKTLNTIKTTGWLWTNINIK